MPTVIPFLELLAAVERLAEACGETITDRSTARRAVNPNATGGIRRYLPDLPPADERARRARQYVSTIEGAVSGQGGHDQTYRVACLLVRDFAIEPEAAWPIINSYNQGCRPPWSPTELQHKLVDADNYVGLRGIRLIPATSSNPHSLACHVLVGHFGELKYWRERWWIYDGHCYREIARADMPPRVSKALNQILREMSRDREQPERPRSRITVTQKLVGDVMLALQSQCLIAHNIEMPSLLPGGAKRNYITMRNGIVDMDALLRGETNVLIPHTPEWFSRVALPCDYNRHATCPRWRAVLDRSLSGDAELINLLLEWFGYCLLSDTKRQKFLMMVGEGANGKSVVCAVLAAMLGIENVCHVPLEQFGDPFSLAQTDGKLANIASEVGEIDRAAEGLLKAFTSGDRMTFNRKYKDLYETIPTARLTLATNTLPRFRDRSSGIWRRMLLMPFRTVIPVDERVVGMDSVEWWTNSGELSGIFNDAVEGLRRLIAQNGFTEAAAMAAAMGEYRRDSNPALMFLDGHCRAEGPNDRIAKSELFREYREWCEKNGFDRPLASSQFRKEVHRRFPEITEGRMTGSTRPEAYIGLRFAPLGFEDQAAQDNAHVN